MKKLLIFILPLAIFISPAAAIEAMESEAIEVSISGITLIVQDNNVHVKGANGSVLKIYKLTGVEVASMRIDGSDKSFTLNVPKGVYILQVGKVVRKIAIN